MREFAQTKGRSTQRKAPARRTYQTAADAVGSLKSPGQRLDPQTLAFFESRFAHDFSRVRIHANDRAAESAAALGALAYTFGAQIAFAKGEYRPETGPGRSLLAHELAHVIQQKDTIFPGGVPEIGNPSDRAEAEADAASRSVGMTGENQLPAGALFPAPALSNSPKPVLRTKPVPSWGGIFDTPVYELCTEPCGGSKTSRGVNMALTFEPTEAAHAEKIALVQTAQTVVDNVAQVVDTNNFETTKNRMVATAADEGSAEELGLHIDSMGAQRTPLAGMIDPAKGNSLAESTPGPTSENVKGFKAQFGWTSKKKSPPMQKAVFSDIPRFSAAKGQEASQILETTALAVEGDQQGAYYGSVRWGWTKSSSSDKATIIEFQAAPHALYPKGESVPKDAAPSPLFFEAAKKWNESKNAAGDPSIPLPKDFTDMFLKSAAELMDDKGKSLGKLAQNTHVGVMGPSASAGARKVVVVDGKLSGQVGSVKDDNLSAQEVKPKK